MPSPYLGEVRLFAGLRLPSEDTWLPCDGRTMYISQNAALFSVIGNAYGGDGNTTFALPNLPGRIPIGMGKAPGLQPRTPGQQGGEEQVTLTADGLAAHSHQLNTNAGDAQSTSPEGGYLSQASVPTYATDGGLVSMSSEAIKAAPGGGQAHENMPPFLAINYLICIAGIFPSRT
jgi:microcystin-dependent protein